MKPDYIYKMLMLRLMGRLPLSVLYFFSWVIYLFNCYLLLYRKNVIRKNLAIAFPEMSDKGRKRLMKKFYHNLADTIVETLKGLYISESELIKRVHFQNIEIIEEAKKNGQTVVLLAAHHCNWEWALQAANILFPMPLDGIYKPLRSSNFDKLTRTIRTRFGGSLISINNVARDIVANRGRSRVIGIIGDQRPMKGARKYWGKMFNVDTAFFPGSEQVPKMANAVTVFVHLRKVKRGYYRNEIIKIAQPPYDENRIEIINEYIRKMETMILEDPASWLWSHNRWKYAKQESEFDFN